MVDQLTPRTPNLEVWGSNLARRIVSLHPGVKIGTGHILPGGNTAMGIASRPGKSRNTPSHTSC